MMKDNVVEIDWSDEILAKTVLTHGSENKADNADKAATPPSSATGKGSHKKPKSAAPGKPAATTPTAA
jgi:NAD(P) transhydrogenase subunit alpha